MSIRPVVLVTGASKGIGAAVAELFAREGYDVCINYLSDDAGARSVADGCARHGARATIVRADVASERDVRRLFDACDKDLGPLDCLINNAGMIGGATALADLSSGALQATFAANVFGTVYCTKEAINRMSTVTGGNGGTIVNMSSVAATTGSPNEYVHYAASKAAVETLTIGAGRELAPLGVRVNAIRVGTTNTSLHAASGNPERPAKIAAITPMGRIAEPSDIAEATLWLAGSRSGFVTGTILTVAGGLAV